MPRKIDRFLQYLEYKGITENRATVECGLSNGLIGQAKRGKSDLGEKAVEKVLIKYQDLERVWLLTGEGPMLKEASTATAPADSESVSIDRQAWEVIRSQAASLERKDKQMDELLAMLRNKIEKGEDADYRGHAATRAAAE
ncbi:MAG: hypothetical protein K2I32_07080 [Alistipes sp.]|nr:hypothetical protein [Alistipes sp.]